MSQVAAGKRDDATRTLASLEALSKQRFVPSFSLAVLLNALGRKSEAHQRLTKASQELPPGQYQRLLRELESPP